MHRSTLTNDLLCALDVAAYEQLQPYLRHATFARGEVFYQPGDPIDRVYFPHKGVFALLSLMHDGAAVETATVGRESAVGLLAALAPLRSFSQVSAQSDGLASSIDARRLRLIAATSPQLREVLARHCDALLAGAQQSVACNALHDVEARLSRWLLICHDRTEGDTIAVTQEFLGRMLGVQRTTVTQVVGVLQEAGLVLGRRGRVRIVDRHGLERRACECYHAVRLHADHVLPETPAENGPCAA